MFFMKMQVWWLSVLAALPLAAQRVEALHFEELRRSKVSYLSRFVETRIGDSLDIGRLKRDVQRLKNLAAIADAKALVDTNARGGVDVRIELTENWTLYPVVNFGGIRGNFWYQLGVTDANWMGNGSQMTLWYLNNDRRHNFQLFYRIPYLRGSPWGLSATAYRLASVEPFRYEGQRIDYDFQHWSLGASITRELAIDHSLEAGAFYFREKYQRLSNPAPAEAPLSLEQPKWLFKFIHRIRKLDFHYFYLHGWSVVSRYETVHNLGFGDWFHLANADLHYYHRTGRRGNAAARLRLGVSSHKPSPFAPFLLDSRVTIRGSGNRVDRGTAVIALNLEYRHSVFESQRFAAQCVVFTDAGTWRLPGGDWAQLLDRRNFRHFAGGGLRFIYKQAWDAILSIDYGIDLYDPRQHGPVLYVGQYF